MDSKILVKVYPNAPRSEVAGFVHEVLRVKIAAPPVRDRANKELTAFLSEILGVSKSRVTILKGHNSRSKLVSISGLTQNKVMERLFPGTKES